MARLHVFNSISVDGYFKSPDGDLGWAHQADDAEWNEFVGSNAQGGGRLLFGRVTYEMMASYWPTPMAAQNDPVVAEGMNKLPKIVFSRTLNKVTWNNTKLLKGDLAKEVRAMKDAPGADVMIFGSGTIVAQLARENLIDEYQLITVPVVLGKGKGLFDGLDHPLTLKRTKTRAFKNGNVLACYEPG
jgi:dihydrofolate reductase